MLMVRELTEKEIQQIWNNLDSVKIIQYTPFWEWTDAIRIEFAKALFEAARVHQKEYDEPKK